MSMINASPRWAITTLAATLLVSSLAMLQGCGRSSHADTGVEPYLHLVSTRSLTAESYYLVDREFAGEIQADNVSQLGFEFGGRIDELKVNIGDTVLAGQVLATLDTQLLESARDELRAQRAELSAELDTQQRNLERIQRLQAESLASERELDELEGRTRALRASLDRVDAAIEANEIRLDKSELRAPFDAIVSTRLVDAGTVVDAGMPVYRMVESSQREIRAGVPVSIAAGLNAGDSLWVRNGADMVEGEILGVSPEVDPATRTRAVRVRVSSTWPSGDLAYLVISVPVEKEGFWLPDSAVTEGVRGTWVAYVAQPSDDSTSVLETRSVVIHHVYRNELFVSGALSPKENVVTSGLQRLSPGQRVRTQQEPVLAHVDSRD